MAEYAGARLYNEIGSRALWYLEMQEQNCHDPLWVWWYTGLLPGVARNGWEIVRAS